MRSVYALTEPLVRIADDGTMAVKLQPLSGNGVAIKVEYSNNPCIHSSGSTSLKRYTLDRVFCNPANIANGSWMLYMRNGNDGQYKSSLATGSSAEGFGDIALNQNVNVKTGAYKLPESLFDTMNFSAILAVSEDENGVSRVRR